MKFCNIGLYDVIKFKNVYHVIKAYNEYYIIKFHIAHYRINFDSTFCWFVVKFSPNRHFCWSSMRFDIFRFIVADHSYLSATLKRLNLLGFSQTWKVFFQPPGNFVLANNHVGVFTAPTVNGRPRSIIQTVAIAIAWWRDTFGGGLMMGEMPAAKIICLLGTPPTVTWLVI